MVKDLILDTHVLCEFIAQYYENKIFDSGLCVENATLTRRRAIKINAIITEYRNNETYAYGLIVASSMAIIEIGRKFVEISQNRYNALQLKSFLNELPPYLHIAPIEKVLTSSLYKVPKYITDSNGDIKPIEFADAIHVATYFSRDSAVMLTNDERIQMIPEIEFIE